MDIGGLLKTALVNFDDARERSQQTELGPSSVYGCSTAAWHIINQTPKTNFQTETMSATMGTAIHEVIAQGLKKTDTFDDFMIEFELATPEIKGHIDFYSQSYRTLIDWKTVTLKKIKSGDWLDKQKKMQVQIYGYLLEENGFPIETLALCAIPRDGWKFEDVVWHTELYNREIALQGIEWVKNIKQMETPPPPEKDLFWCKNFCSYFDESGETGCKGKLTVKK